MSTSFEDTMEKLERRMSGPLRREEPSPAAGSNSRTVFTDSPASPDLQGDPHSVPPGTLPPSQEGEAGPGPETPRAGTAAPPNQERGRSSDSSSQEERGGAYLEALKSELATKISSMNSLSQILEFASGYNTGNTGGAPKSAGPVPASGPLGHSTPKATRGQETAQAGTAPEGDPGSIPGPTQKATQHSKGGTAKKSSKAGTSTGGGPKNASELNLSKPGPPHSIPVHAGGGPRNDIFSDMGTMPLHAGGAARNGTSVATDQATAGSFNEDPDWDQSEHEDEEDEEEEEDIPPSMESLMKKRRELDFRISVMKKSRAWLKPALSPHLTDQEDMTPDEEVEFHNLTEEEREQRERKLAGLPPSFKSISHSWLQEALPPFKYTAGLPTACTNYWYSLRAEGKERCQGLEPGPGSKPAVCKITDALKYFQQEEAFQAPPLPDCFVDPPLRTKDEVLKEQQNQIGTLGACLVKAGALFTDMLEMIITCTHDPAQRGMSHETLQAFKAKITENNHLQKTISTGCKITAGWFNELNAKRRAAALKVYQGRDLQGRIDREHPACLAKLFKGDVDSKVRKATEDWSFFRQALSKQNSFNKDKPWKEGSPGGGRKNTNQSKKSYSKKEDSSEEGRGKKRPHPHHKGKKHQGSKKSKKDSSDQP